MFKRFEAAADRIVEGFDLAVERAVEMGKPSAEHGLELQQTFKSGDTTWTPYGVLSAVREMQGEQRFTIGDVFTGHTSTKGTSAQVEFGVNARFGRADIWGGLNWTDGGALDSFIGGQIGVRYTW